jgi:deoxycytidylate deaminase
MDQHAGNPTQRVTNEEVQHHPVLKDYPMLGWVPDDNLSDDDNWMDMVLVLTRNSICRQGHMACAIVRPSNGEPLLDRLVSVANNTAVFKPYDSDNHAEVNAVGTAAKWGQSTLGCAAVITMPPCKRCFGLLLAAGICKIVTARPILEPVASIAKKRGVEIVIMDWDTVSERIARLVPQPDRIQVAKDRERRKLAKRKRQGIVHQEQSGDASKGPTDS